MAHLRMSAIAAECIAGTDDSCLTLLFGECFDRIQIVRVRISFNVFDFPTIINVGTTIVQLLDLLKHECIDTSLVEDQMWLMTKARLNVRRPSSSNKAFI